MMKAVILAGGKGQRMGALARDVPKPMLRVGGRPVLDYQLALVKRHGVGEVVIALGHLGHVIEDYCGDGSRWGLKIRCQREESPLGTAGAVRGVASSLEDDCVVLYGDTMLDVDLTHMAEFHRRHKALATLMVHPNDHPLDSDLVELGPDGRIVACHRRPHPPGFEYHNTASAALYVMSPGIAGHLPAEAPRDFGADVFPALAAQGAAIYGYPSAEYIADIGTPARLAKVDEDVRNGRVESMSRWQRRPAVFLDRDGVLNVQRTQHVRRPDELTLLPGVPEAVAMLNRSRYLAVVATNQPMIAQGHASEEDLDRVHRRLETLLGAHGAYLDRIYHCPHHPERGHAGERSELKINCDCRKPATGMIDRATAELNIDLAGSWLIGDRAVDMEAGRRAGLSTIAVGTQSMEGQTGPAPPQHVCAGLTEAVRLVLSRAPSGRLTSGGCT